MTKDAVNNPSHYTSHPSGVECIEITEHMNFNLGNAIKYVWRSGLKKGGCDKEIEDLRKARWYIAREIERLGYDTTHDYEPHGTKHKSKEDITDVKVTATYDKGSVGVIHVGDGTTLTEVTAILHRAIVRALTELKLDCVHTSVVEVADGQTVHTSTAVKTDVIE